MPMVFSFPVVTDETLSFIQKSRRLLVVLSPNYVLQGTQALLELKAGLENMASRGSINVILVQYKAVKETKVPALCRPGSPRPCRAPGALPTFTSVN